MNRTTAEGAVIYAPLGRDADIAASLLADGDLESRIARDLAELVATIRGGVGYAILTEEAVRGADLRALTAVLAEQAEWSDLPFVMLTARGGGLERNPGAVRLLETLGNVTFLERPFHPTTLISLAKAARRARRRQYEARARLEEIAAGRERLSLALASGGLGAWIYEVKGAGLTTDAQCRAHYGLAADARFAFEDLLARIHDEDRQRMLATVLVAIEGATDYDIEYRVVWPDRSIHWLRINGRAERDAAGQVARMVGVSHDITDQRRIEARQRALIALGDGLRQADDATAMSRVAVRVLGETLGVSRAGYGTVDALRETVSIDCEWTAPGVAPLTGERSFRAYGSFVDDLKRGDWIAIADARTDPRTADRAEALEAIASRAVLNMPVVRAGTLVALLFVNQREPRAWMPDDVAFVHDVAGRTQAAIERRQAETALADLAGSLERQVEERTRERDRTWRNSQDLLAVIDGEGQFVAVNPAWTSVLGWQANEVVGRHHLDFNHPDDHLLSKAALAQAQEGQLPPSEKRMRHRDGSYRWVSWIASAGEGMVYASGRHVTAEKEAQLALEGTQDQLRQAQKMEAVGQLTGGIAHDFNNLLTAISGSLELIQLRVGQGRTGDVARYVDTATQAAKRAAALTHRLLAFSRRQTLDPRPSDLDALIANMRDLLERSVGPTIEIHVAAPEGALWTTLVDPNQFENALLNLCINARDAMRDGGRIAISTANIVLDRREAAARELAAGDYVMLAVSDSGAGMDAETIARAFDPFFTTKPLGEGTGLGLSMIYGFVRQSGGQVRIDSTVGVGTTMRLYFPRVADAEAAPETAAPAIEVKPVDADRVVLVVDDEAAVRMLVRDVVTDMGCAVIEAEDALAAMAVVESSARIDLMVTDVGLPGGTNGRELAKAARAIRADLTILFITGYAEAAVMGDGAPGAGMHLMTKPFSIDAIGARIRGLLA